MKDYKNILTRTQLALFAVLEWEGTWTVVRTISGEVERIYDRLDELRGMPDEVVEAMVEEDIREVEDMLGVALVATQVVISRVTQIVVDVRAQIGEEISPNEVGREHCGRIGEQAVVNLLYHCGNFYKHQDQWRKRLVKEGDAERLKWEENNYNRQTLRELRAFADDALHAGRPVSALCGELGFTRESGLLKPLPGIVMDWKSAHVRELQKRLP